MKRNARLDEIVKICKGSGYSDIKSLSRALGVSEITIRRDLNLLENLRLVKKAKKGVVAIESQYLSSFVDYNIETEYQKKTEQKKRIGHKAVSMIESGETIIFDSGSTLYYAVLCLPENVPIKAICYGLKIAEVLKHKHVIQLILLGGMYHKETDMFESFWEYDELNKIRAQKAFVSAFGIHKQAGLTSGSFFASSIRRKILASSEKVFLLADSSKFGKIECAHYGDLMGIDTIITDEEISRDYMELFSDLGIPVIRV